MQLDGAVALVTGSADRIGRAIALSLAEAGADVVVHHRDSEPAARATADAIAYFDRRAVVVQADLTLPADVERLFEESVAGLGRLDLLVNSAAMFKKQRFAAVGVDDWDRTLAVNLRAPFLCMQHAQPLLADRAHRAGATGLVVNIADLSGQFPWRGYVQHGVSKAGLLHLTAIAARELGPDVRVNAIVPGPILPPPGLDEASPEWHAMGNSLPLGRVGDPQDVARAVRFLAESDYVTGAVIHVDGGQHLLGPAGH
jgi:pteridine reductase